MKWFCRIFSLYLLVLSCLPCSDGDHKHAVQQGSRITYLASNAGHPSHERCNDTCSPFCTCQCCTTHYTVRNYSSLTFEKVVLLSKKAEFPALACRVRDVALAVDHPPQLV